jgi:hypothetical protein
MGDLLYIIDGAVNRVTKRRHDITERIAYIFGDGSMLSLVVMIALPSLLDR